MTVVNNLAIRLLELKRTVRYYLDNRPIGDKYFTDFIVKSLYKEITEIEEKIENLRKNND